ncbi:sodium-dependent phosphate transport protein 2A-like [Glandiceps talaboti]
MDNSTVYRHIPINLMTDSTTEDVRPISTDDGKTGKPMATNNNTPTTGQPSSENMPGRRNSSGSESTSSAEGSSIPGANRMEYSNIHSDASSVTSSAPPSTVSSACPSRATSMTDLLGAQKEQFRLRPDDMKVMRRLVKGVAEKPIIKNNKTEGGNNHSKDTKQKGVKWSDTESQTSSGESSASSTPSTIHRPTYIPIPTSPSSVFSSAPASAAPSAASSAFPSRATSVTELSDIEPAQLRIDQDFPDEDLKTLEPEPDIALTPIVLVINEDDNQQSRDRESHDAAAGASRNDVQANIDINTGIGNETDVPQGGANPQEQGDTDGMEEDDPWNSLPEFKSMKPAWSTLTCGGKIKRVLIDWIGKTLLVFTCLYFFIVALALMGDAFTLIGGSAAGAALSDSTILENSITGLMIGMLVTVLLQSSSATTSIIVSMVASDIIQVQEAIPMVMGANLGTSVTNTIVAGGQAGDRDSFRLSFAGATVHDCFNWLAVLVLLPLETLTGYLYHLTSAIVESSNLHQIKSNDRISITDPITEKIIQIDISVLERIALGEIEPGEESLVDRWCVTEEHYYNETFYDSNGTLYNYTEVHNYTDYIERCDFLFAYSDLADEIIGLILLIFSLVLLMGCLIGIVKVLNSMLRGSAAIATKKFLNANFPGKLSWLTGYVAILIGALFTMLLQSSSVFTSMLTPLVGMRIITLERMFPLTLGANIGTTFTSLIAAFASSSSTDFEEGVQISLCHLFFNLSGILLFFPIPFTRKPPLNGAKFLGNTTAKYRWFSIAYVLTVFFILPAIVLVLSLLGWQYLALFLIIFGVILIFVITLKILQYKCQKRLPKKLQNWKFLPKCLRSLEPYDNLITKCMMGCRKCKVLCRCGKGGDASINETKDVSEEEDSPVRGVVMRVIDTNQGEDNPVIDIGDEVNGGAVPNGHVIAIPNSDGIKTDNSYVNEAIHTDSNGNELTIEVRRQHREKDE